MTPNLGRAFGLAAVLVLGLSAILPIVGADGAFHPATGTSTGAGCSPGSGLSLSATPTAGAAPLAVQFSISDPRGPPLWVNWTFGDGSSADAGGNASSSLLSTRHTYSTLGLFEAVVNVTQGAESLFCAAAVEVNPVPFSLQVHAAPQAGSAPLVVRFTVDLTGGTGAYSFARWTFGDGDSATGFNVSYTYAAPGNYTAALTVIDSANQTAADQVAIQVNASDGHSSPGGGGSMGLLSAWEIVAILLAVVVLVGFGVVRWWARGRTNGPRDDLDVESPRTGTGPPGPEGDLGAPSPETPAPASAPSPTFVEVVVPPAREAAPSLPIAPVAATESLGPALETTAPRTTPPPVDEPSGPRLKLSQRVMLHLYLQGHLADGEVAPVGFTQGGMADKLEVAQSPLSSVLRRLLVAGLVTQDTRHVRGQPRRLRVYRLTPVGDVVARDLYRQSLGEGESPPKVA